jgi:hypothetical protein
MATTTTIARPARTGRALAALLAGAIAVTAAYHATRSLLNEDPVTTIPAASTPATASPFQVMSDLTPVVSAQLGSSAVAADPFQAMSDLTPVVSAQLGSSAVAADPFQAMSDLTPLVSAQAVDRAED